MILVLGATGFVGKAVCENLDARGIAYTSSSLSLGTDLTDRQATLDLFQLVKPEKVINCSAFVGGIEYGYRYPIELFERNILMGVNILHAARQTGVKRLVNPISNCAYPGRATVFREAEFWDGPLHESVMVYGYVRKALWVGSWAYHRQVGLDVLSLVVSNMYGPRDHFDEARSHAVGALIKKVVEAKRTGAPTVNVWGSGKPVREWLYVGDGAEALVRGLDCEASEEPVNVGVMRGISIADLAETIKRIAEYDGKLVYDASKPDGAPFKTVDGTNGAKLLNWSPQTPLDIGLQETVAWYLRNEVA